MSNLALNQLTALSPTTNLITVAPGDTVYSPGSVVQVVQNYFSTQSAVSIAASYTAPTDVPDLKATITPKSVNSKIYVMVRWVGEYGTVGQVWNSMWNLKRGSTLIGRDATWPTDRVTGIQTSLLNYYSADNNSTLEAAYFDYLDSPATTGTITYTACMTTDTAFTLYTNRTVGVGAGGYEYATSSVTLWEIAQ